LKEFIQCKKCIHLRKRGLADVGEVSFFAFVKEGRHWLLLGLKMN
jgi:hypothetical protein